MGSMLHRNHSMLRNPRFVILAGWRLPWFLLVVVMANETWSSSSSSKAWSFVLNFVSLSGSTLVGNRSRSLFGGNRVSDSSSNWYGNSWHLEAHTGDGFGDCQKQEERETAYHRLFREHESKDSSDVFSDENADAWIGRMTNYLSSEKDAIFRDQKVAVIASSLPDEDCRKIAAEISKIGCRADKLYFVMSPQDQEYYDEIRNNDGYGEPEPTTPNLAHGGGDSSEMGMGVGLDMEVMEIFDFDDVVDTEMIDVVVLSTKSGRVVSDDSFVNDFLRRTDAWIHMGSEFGDDFSLHARLQEGANITLW